MIEERASVVEVADGRVWVETRRKSACGQCSVNKGCGTASLDRFFGERRNRIEVIADAAYAVGDEVLIGLRDDALLRGAVAVYLLPLAMLMVAALLGKSVAVFFNWPVEPCTIISGLIGLAAGFYWLRRFTARISRNPDYQAVILQRIGDGDSPSVRVIFER